MNQTHLYHACFVSVSFIESLTCFVSVSFIESLTISVNFFSVTTAPNVTEDDGKFTSSACSKRSQRGIQPFAV